MLAKIMIIRGPGSRLVTFLRRRSTILISVLNANFLKSSMFRVITHFPLRSGADAHWIGKEIDKHFLPVKIIYFCLYC